MATTTAKLTIAGIAFAAATCLGASASYAYGDAPWCAVMELGPGAAVWDCEYRTVEECVPHVIAGNRGVCSLNPWPGPVQATPVRHPRHRFHHARRR